mmetsp:Transcript_5295/g.12014  ORF Transcript_5295/g.12014 Transcript_5295/m.12014 type:complete len:142 (-) Transcript_5295:217-642(-)
MSLFTRSIRHQSPKIQALWCAHNQHGHRCIATYAHAGPMDVLASRFFALRQLFPITNSPSINTGTVAMVTDTTLTSIGANMVDNLQSLLGDLSTWLIKRTYQPSIIRKRRKHGFMRRKESVGGRRVLRRRMAKGRMRLGGS